MLCLDYLQIWIRTMTLAKPRAEYRRHSDKEEIFKKRDNLLPIPKEIHPQLLNFPPALTVVHSPQLMLFVNGLGRSWLDW